LALALAQAGIRLVGMLTNSQSPWIDELESAGVSLISGHRVVRARGGRWVKRVELARTGADKVDLVLDCAMMAVEAPEAPCYELANHAGCELKFHSQTGHTIHCDDVGRTSVENIYAVGHNRGARSLEEARHQGMRTGLTCALSINDDASVQKRLQQLEESWRKR
jgi:thioredoxin reductase